MASGRYRLTGTLDLSTADARKKIKQLERDLQSINKKLNVSTSVGDSAAFANVAGSTDDVFQARDAVVSFNEQLDGTNKRAAILNEKFRGLGKTVKGIFISLTMYQSLTALVGIMQDIAKQSITLSAELDHVSTGMKQLEETSGMALSTISDEMKKASQGTLSLAEAMKFTSSAYMLGGEALVGNLPELFDIARVSARALGMDAEKAMESLTTGIGRQSARWLDNLGIIIDTRKAYKDYAIEIGKTSATLSEQEQIQAIVNEITEKYGHIANATGSDVRTYAEDVQYLSKSWQDLLAETSHKGGFIDETVVFLGDMLSALSDNLEGWNELKDVIDGSVGKDIMFPDIDAAAKEHKKSLSSLSVEYYLTDKAVEGYKHQIQLVTEAAYKEKWTSDELAKSIANVNLERKALLYALGREDIVEASQQLLYPKLVLGPPEGSGVNRDLEEQFQSEIENSIKSALKNGKIDESAYYDFMSQLNDIPSIDATGKSDIQLFAEHVAAYEDLANAVDKAADAKIRFINVESYQPTDEYKDLVNDFDKLQKDLEELDSVSLSLFKFDDVGAEYAKAKAELDQILSSSAPLEIKSQAIKDHLSFWAPYLSAADREMRALLGIADSFSGKLDSALMGIADNVSKETFMDYYYQVESAKQSNEDFALSADNAGEAIWELANRNKGLEDTLIGIETSANGATTSLSQLASQIESDVIGAMTETLTIQPWDFLDGYEDAPLETVRQLMDVANKGTGSEFFSKFIWDGTIPEDVAAQGEQAIKAYAEKLVAEGKNLEHPEWLDTEALVREVKENLEAEARRQETIDLGIDAVLAAGLYTNRSQAEKAVKETMGIPSADAYSEGITEGLKDDNIGLKISGAVRDSIADNDKQFQEAGKTMAQLMWQGLEEWIEDQTLIVPTTLAGCASSIVGEESKE